MLMWESGPLPTVLKLYPDKGTQVTKDWNPVWALIAKPCVPGLLFPNSPKDIAVSSLYIQQEEASFSNCAKVPYELAANNWNKSPPLILSGVHFASKNLPHTCVYFCRLFSCCFFPRCFMPELLGSFLFLKSHFFLAMLPLLLLTPPSKSSGLTSGSNVNSLETLSACFDASKSGHLSDQDDEELRAFKTPPFHPATHCSLSLTWYITNIYVSHNVLGTWNTAVNKEGRNKSSYSLHSSPSEIGYFSLWFHCPSLLIWCYESPPPLTLHLKASSWFLAKAGPNTLWHWHPAEMSCFSCGRIYV